MSSFTETRRRRRDWLQNQVMHRAGSTKDTGHGFGLSMSYRMIEHHGGHISVDDHEQKGAVLTITLPIKKPKRVAAAA